MSNYFNVPQPLNILPCIYNVIVMAKNDDNGVHNNENKLIDEINKLRTTIKAYIIINALLLAIVIIPLI